MLENWVWNKQSLKLLSAHYKDSSSIDEKLIEDLIKTKNSASGFQNMRFVNYFFLNRKILFCLIFLKRIKSNFVCQNGSTFPHPRKSKIFFYEYF